MTGESGDMSSVRPPGNGGYGEFFHRMASVRTRLYRARTEPANVLMPLAASRSRRSLVTATDEGTQRLVKLVTCFLPQKRRTPRRVLLLVQALPNGAK